VSENRVDRLVALGRRLDRALPGPVYEVCRRCYNAYLESPLLNRIRRARDYARLWVFSRARTAPAELHLGCGWARTEMCDIDIIKTPTTDYVLDAGSLPLPDNSVERIESYHMIEHVPRNELPRMVAEWARVLESGGRLVLELPAFDDVVTAYLETDDGEDTETLLRYVFGSQRFESDYHYWGWNKSRLGAVLRANGFEDVTRKPATDSHADEAPCMRIEAVAAP